MNERLTKPYDPKETEPRIYKMWEDSGFFNPDKLIEAGHTKKDAQPFALVLPPPNVTGTLHIGHAFEDGLQDVMVRYARMRGLRTVWIPGTDSAAIATQSKVEKELYKKEKKTRYDLGREAFLERVHAFALGSHDTIVGQVRRLGASLDWSREAFTLDDTRNRAVYAAFERMYAQGLIYRGDRIVNWDPKGQTTISDDEIIYKEETAKFYYLKYGPFTIGTTRPETKFGDKYVVMHPLDTRYSAYENGQKIELEWINGPITATVIKDEVMDMEMGSGVMTITPAHSTVDFELAQKYNLDKEQVIDERGILLPIAGEFAGQHIKKAREAIVAKLEQKGLVEKVDEYYIHNIATAERTGEIIEPQIKRQWFVNVNKEFTLKHSKIDDLPTGTTVTLKEIMRRAVASGQIEFIPDRFTKNYFHWIDNLRDWCISRQIWYGHRIPVWYRGDEVRVAFDQPEGAGWEQDQDTLDTWFSSALWTFSTLGWPKDTEDLRLYHPNAVMAPGYEIIFFWIARMILMSGFLLGDIPFRKVYIHGMVRDKDGQKFSKSLDNGVDPLEVADTYGADALRMALIVGTGPGSDVKYDSQKVQAYKHFANKLWNITRFVMDNAEGHENLTAHLTTPTDAKLLDRLNQIVLETTDQMEKYQFHLAAEGLYAYVWHEFADKIIESMKPTLKSGGVDEQRSAKRTLRAILETSLKLLHPFMPFVTEELWQIMHDGKRGMLMVLPWPQSSKQ